MFVRFHVEPCVRSDGLADFRLIMSFVRDFALGDRDDGKVEVLSDRVRIGRSRYRERDIELMALSQ
jgi:hypothetical protein